MSTIAAPATPPGESALAVIRVSGSEAERLSLEACGRKSPTLPRQATFAKYIALDGLLLDEVIAIRYEHGKSYTGEAMLEIMSHGNPRIVRLILEDLYARGCTPAEPGEFTRRAFLNGRLDLSQAEGVIDLIQARSARALKVAQRQMQGALGEQMSQLADDIVTVQAKVEAYIDFPEEDLPHPDISIEHLKAVVAKIRKLLDTSSYREQIQDGIKVLIVGAPNAGKSSLINRLLNDERAIVSSTPGTTRDFLRERLEIDGHLIQIIDTAGLRDEASEIEQAGINRAIQLAKSADLFLLVVDAADHSPTLPHPLINRLLPGNTLVLENKIDLPSASAKQDFLPDFPHCRASMTTGQGWSDFLEALKQKLSALPYPSEDLDIAINARHADALKRALDAIQSACRLLANQGELELIATEIRSALDAIAEVVGRIDNEAMLDKLFAQFCIGK